MLRNVKGNGVAMLGGIYCFEVYIANTRVQYLLNNIHICWKGVRELDGLEGAYIILLYSFHCGTLEL